jgi:hypothetical protein
MIRLPDVKSDPDRTRLFTVGQHWVRLRLDRSLGGPSPRQRDGGTMALARACRHSEATREMSGEKKTESRFVIVDSFWSASGDAEGLSAQPTKMYQRSSHDATRQVA